MIFEIRHRLEAEPSQPFRIAMSSGRTYRIATREHAKFNPQKTRVLVFFDDESSIVLSPLHIASVHAEASEGA